MLTLPILRAEPSAAWVVALKQFSLSFVSRLANGGHVGNSIPPPIGTTPATHDETRRGRLTTAATQRVETNDHGWIFFSVVFPSHPRHSPSQWSRSRNVNVFA